MNQAEHGDVGKRMSLSATAAKAEPAVEIVMGTRMGEWSPKMSLTQALRLAETLWEVIAHFVLLLSHF